MKVPEDRNPCLTLFAAEKKPASRFTKKGEVLEDTHEIPQRGSRVQRCCSHVDPVKVPEDRNPCLTLFAAEKKQASRFTKKGEVLEDTHEIPQRGSRVQRCCSHVAPVKVPEDRNPCLTLFAAEKKPALRFTKKGEVLKSTPA